MNTSGLTEELVSEHFEKGDEKLTNTERELRDLMDLYWSRLLRLNKEKEDCLDDEEELVIEAIQRQCRIMVAELFQTMKRLNLLDEEEIEIGAIKNK